MNFSKWLIENGSINQSMPELDSEEIPSGKMITCNPYSSPSDYPPTKGIIGSILIRRPNKQRKYWVVEKNKFGKIEIIKFKNKIDLKNYIQDINKEKDYTIEYYN